MITEAIHNADAWIIERFELFSHWTQRWFGIASGDWDRFFTLLAMGCLALKEIPGNWALGLRGTLTIDLIIFMFFAARFASSLRGQHYKTRCLLCDNSGWVTEWRLEWKRLRASERPEDHSVLVESEEAGRELMMGLTEEDVEARIVSGVKRCSCRLHQSLAGQVNAAPQTEVRGGRLLDWKSRQAGEKE